jgi:hypothetical protein
MEGSRTSKRQTQTKTTDKRAEKKRVPAASDDSHPRGGVRSLSIPRRLIARHGLQPQKDPRHALKRAGGVRRLVIGVFRLATRCLVSLVITMVVRVVVVMVVVIMVVRVARVHTLAVIALSVTMTVLLIVLRVAAAAVNIVNGAEPLERVRLRVHRVVEEPARVRRRRQRSGRRYRGRCDETIDLDGRVVGLFAQFNPREYVSA